MKRWQDELLLFIFNRITFHSIRIVDENRLVQRPRKPRDDVAGTVPPSDDRPRELLTGFS